MAFVGLLYGNGLMALRLGRVLTPKGREIHTKRDYRSLTLMSAREVHALQSNVQIHLPDVSVQISHRVL